MTDRPIQFGVLLAILVFFSATIRLFFPFTADDAYIVARYAANARDLGDWTFNAGERINAMTSPLHGVALVALSRFVADPLPLYKTIAAILVCAAGIVFVVSYGAHRREVLPLAAVLVAPSFLLWTVAGLETPLLAVEVTAMAAIFSFVRVENDRRLLVIGAMAGLAVFTRYDAVLFVGPLFLAATLQSRGTWRMKMVAAALAGALPGLWFLYSLLRFGTVLPTSFYLKTPTAATAVLAANAGYMTEHLAIAGIAVLAVYAAARVADSGTVRSVLADEIRARWGLHAGIAAILLYGASMATVHMMFAFRHFMPYLGATALALVQFARRANERASDAGSARSRRWMEVIAAAMILIVHVFHAEALYHDSLQGIGTHGEYSEQGAAGYARDFIPAMRRNAEDVRSHWNSLGKDRPPRIWTFAAGALPYVYPEAYIFEGLVSYRHLCPSSEPGRMPDWRVWRMHADYIHVFTRHAALRRSLAPVHQRQVRLISNQPIHFNGRDEALLVFFNPAPRPNILPARVNEPCGVAQREGP